MTFPLECSPFGLKNRRRLADPSVGETNSTCRVCKTSYRLSNGRKKHLCPSCHKREIRRNRKLRAIQVKGGACQRCGYSKCVSALEFHHSDRNTKTVAISDYSKGWNTINKELEKCTLVCSNCHREIEEELRVQD